MCVYMHTHVHVHCGVYRYMHLVHVGPLVVIKHYLENLVSKQAALWPAQGPDK